VRIEGFDCGNSPAEYTSERVAGKTLVFTTTNGTRAVARCSAAERVLIASLVNLSAVCGAIADRPGPVDIVCAGTDGCITREDIVTAGAIVDSLCDPSSAVAWRWSDEALVARDAWRGIVATEQPRQSLLAALRDSAGGRNLVALGFDADIVAAAEVDCLTVAPVVAPTGANLRIVSSLSE
jgi:2-phosphosulfolactate phosphatase